MLGSVFCLIALLAGDSPIVEVTTLSGGTASGPLKSLTATTLEIGGTSPATLPVSELLQIDLPAETARPASPATETSSTKIVIELRDGSRLEATGLNATADRVLLTHPLLGDLSFPRTMVRSARFGSGNAALLNAWTELQARTSRQDYLVIQKGEVLDHLDGVIGTLDATTLKFLLDGDNVDVKRQRIYGLIYAEDRASSPKPGGPRVTFDQQQGLTVSQVAWSGTGWLLSWTSPAQSVTVPASALRRIDYSAGKILYLSSVEPRDVEHIPYFGVGGEWPYQRDRNLFGRPLKVGTRVFARGLAMHSKTRLVYRLGGDYRRLTSIAGLDPDLPLNSEPAINNARLEIRGDRKLLFEADIRGGEPPIPLDLDVAGIVDLEILVDFGESQLDIGDRVHLADLKVLK